MHCIEEKTCDIAGALRRPPLIRRPGIAPSSLRHWCDTSRQIVQLWNSQSPEGRSTSSNWENTTTLVRPCIQNAPQKLVRQVLLIKPTAKRPKCRPCTRWRDYISDLAWYRLGVESAELSEIAVDREVFRVLLWMLPPPEHDFSVWPIRTGRFGLSRFGLSRFGLRRFGLRRFGLRRFGLGGFGLADSVWPIRSEPFRSVPFWCGDPSVTTFLYINNWLHLFI